MKAITKLAYYRSAQMKPDLARRYYRLLPPTGRILDVGCGVGGFGALSPGGREVHGIDIDAGAVTKAQEHELARQHDLASSTLPYEDAFFDGVLAKDILEHLTDPAAIVREIERVLRPGGVVVASVVMAKPKAVWADYTHVRGFTQRAARLLFADAGFRVERMWRMGGVPLAARFGFMDAVPTLLRVPGIGWAWASSWELRARKGQL